MNRFLIIRGLVGLCIKFNIQKYGDLSNILQREFGLYVSTYSFWRYEIIDECKFILFMLSYPEHISLISYE